MSSEIEKNLKQLKTGTAQHLRKGKELVDTCPDGFTTLDLYVFGALNRSTSLLTAFVKLIEVDNFMSAAALLRLELDTALSLYAAWLVEDPEQLAKAVMSGGTISELKDRDGFLLQDDYLAKKLGENDPRMEALYKSTSGYMHLSEKHMRNAMETEDGTDAVSIRISPIDKVVAPSVYRESIESFTICAEMVLSLTDGYIQSRASDSQ